MNLAWIAAVLQPYDVAPHPNFPEDDFDDSGPAELASVVLGGLWRSRIVAKEPDDPIDEMVALAEQCLHPKTIALSVGQLAARLSGSPPDDPAKAAALALIACAAAAELDEYQVCLNVLDVQLRRTPKAHTADEGLLRAALLQQKALRLRDAGLPHLPVSVEASAALSQVDVISCSAFPTGPGVSWQSSTTVEQIRDTLRSAISSLVPIDSPERGEIVGLLTWQEQVRGRVSSMTARVARDRANAYADYVRNVFARQWGSRARSIGGPSRPDIFYSVLALELIGDVAVYTGRKELALLRLVQSDGDREQMADSLRLLRHAAAKNELDLALRRLRAAGPLAVLSDDARQVLRTRTAPALLRTVEMRVLHTAAGLLAPAEARVALDAIQTSLSLGGPGNLPGTWELELLRKEVAWVAAAALGNACGAADEVAAFLLSEAARETRDDELLDRSLGRAAAEIEWVGVADSTRQAWLELLDLRAASLRRTAEVVFAEIGRPVPAPVAPSAMDLLIHRLNAVLKRDVVDPNLALEGAQLLRDALRKIRSDAAKGSYSMGGVSVGDVAASLIVAANARDLWPDLAEFLLDLRVQREDRTPAFERLARSTVPLPTAIARRFRASARQLLVAQTPDPFGASLIPYPAALRFLGVHGLVEDADSYDAVAALAGSAMADARREAAVTVAVFAAAHARSQLLALALPLARDEDVEVRAYAGRALALMVRAGDPLAVVALRRLVELLAEDGLLAPLLVLRALAEVRHALPGAVRGQAEELALQHPSRLVRMEAERLLARQDSD